MTITLYPVIQPITKINRDSLTGKERVALLSSISREALRLSADKSGVVLGETTKDERDVPLPFDGNHWSVSHKPQCAAAVVSKDRIGIDVEKIIPRADSIFDLVAGEQEWLLSEDPSWDTFFRYWTAKEAVLKALGIGIGGLRACRVVSVADANHIVLNHLDRTFLVEQKYHMNHIISVIKDDNEIRWVIASEYCH